MITCLNALKAAVEGRGKLVSTAGKAIKSDESVLPKQAGFTGGASQAGMTFGAARKM